MENSLAKKLLIRPGHRVLLQNAPDGMLDQLLPLPDGAQIVITPGGLFDVVLLFVRNKAEVDALAESSIQAARDAAVVWMIYPKRSKSVRTDINRDSGWDALWQAGWTGIAIAAINETWAALRFRPAKDVKRSPTSTMR